jgi:hypothetical protein
MAVWSLSGARSTDLARNLPDGRSLVAAVPPFGRSAAILFYTEEHVV